MVKFGFAIFAEQTPRLAKAVLWLGDKSDYKLYNKICREVPRSIKRPDGSHDLVVELKEHGYGAWLVSLYYYEYLYLVI